MAKTYKEKLLDVRWQKRRLEILEKDYWQCRACLTKDGSFHVHHLWYEGEDPWNAPDEALVTLCSSCHEKAGSVNWKQAFLDLNLCESELLEIASQLHFMKEKWAMETADLQQKYKVRYKELVTDLRILEDEDDVNEYFQNFRRILREKYTNG